MVDFVLICVQYIVLSWICALAEYLFFMLLSYNIFNYYIKNNDDSKKLNKMIFSKTLRATSFIYCFPVKLPMSLPLQVDE